MSVIPLATIQFACGKCGGTNFSKPHNLEAKDETAACGDCGAVFTIDELRAAGRKKAEDLVKELADRLRR